MANVAKLLVQKSQLVFFVAKSRNFVTNKKDNAGLVTVCKSRYLSNTVPASPHSTWYLPQSNPSTKSSPRVATFVGRGTRVPPDLPFAIRLPINLSLSSGTLHALLHWPSRNLLSLLESRLARNSVFEVFFSIDHSRLIHLLHSS